MKERILLLPIIAMIYSVTIVIGGPRFNFDLSRPPYIDCVSSDECDKSECCAVNQGRYSVPTCRTRPELGDPCRPRNVPYSVNVTYPDDVTVSLKGIYLMLCPCQGLLTCSSYGECIDPSDESKFNYMNDIID